MDNILHASCKQLGWEACWKAIRHDCCAIINIVYVLCKICLHIFLTLPNFNNDVPSAQNYAKTSIIITSFKKLQLYLLSSTKQTEKLDRDFQSQLSLIKHRSKAEYVCGCVCYISRWPCLCVAQSHKHGLVVWTTFDRIDGKLIVPDDSREWLVPCHSTLQSTIGFSLSRLACSVLVWGCKSHFFCLWTVWTS